MPVAEVKEPPVSEPVVLADAAKKRKQNVPLDAPYAVIGFEWLAKVFNPKAFLVGAGLGFLICCCLGYLTTTKNQFGDIKRFGVYVGPQASFYPTIKQLIALVKSRITKGQTLVLVGGSSILNGVGQSNEQLWTNRLQEDLGDKYVVVNLALRSCNSYEGAYFVAEAMSKQYDKLIFVTSAAPNADWHPMGQPPYAYLYWDAKYHNLLQNFPEREQAIAEREKKLPDEIWKPEALTELQLSQWMNSNFHFMELWNTVGYRYFFTSYRTLTGESSFQPRRKLPNNMEAYEVFPIPDDKFGKWFFPVMSGSLYKWDAAKKDWAEDKAHWDRVDQTIATNVVPELRTKTLVLLLATNPELRKKYLSDSLMKRDRLAFAKATSVITKYGMHTLEAGDDYQGSDFRDTMHLGPTGGYKLADQTAIEVKKMARELGYEK